MSRRAALRIGVGLGLGLALLAAPVTAPARSAITVSYPVGEVWATAVRFLRVDRGYPIREKDEGAGYVLFDHSDSGKSHRGALELIPVVDGEGRPSTQLAFSIPDLPRHYETALLDRLAAKLREERGSPPPPPPRRRPPAGDGADRDRDGKDRDRGRPGADGGLPRAPGGTSTP